MERGWTVEQIDAEAQIAEDREPTPHVAWMLRALARLMRETGTGIVVVDAQDDRYLVSHAARLLGVQTTSLWRAVRSGRLRNRARPGERGMWVHLAEARHWHATRQRRDKD